jgi:putative redox protein
MGNEARAIIRFAGDDFFVATTPSGHAQVLDARHERASAASPMELLLIALGGCTAVDVISILRKKREKVTNYRVEVSGSRREEHPRSYSQLAVHHVVRGHALSKKAVAQAIGLSETKYCSVAATLRSAAEIITTFEIEEEPADGADIPG